MIGETLSHYRITAELGSGGMGVVYQAEDLRLKRRVALKFLPAELTRDKEAKARFVQEAQAASALDHPNVCTIYEIGQADDGRLFLAMASYAGETLKERIARGPLPPDEVFAIVLQIAEGLAKAHGEGIVHRDIKPANIFITTDRLVKILDFGVAKLKGDVQLTQAGTTIGTAAYMSPEQARGEKVDRRTDIWSLGVVLYEMLARRLPFRGEHEQAVIYSILNDEPEPLRVASPQLEQVVSRALVRPLEDRYQHVAELLVDLKAVTIDAASWPLAAPPAPMRLSRLERFFVSGGLVALVALLAVIGYQKCSGPAPAIDSIVVLPLENLSGDPDQEYFADGMTELLIGDLGRIRSLRVISRTSAMRYKRTDKTLPEIAAELDVDAVVEGTVFREGDTVRITAQLIDAATDGHLWADRFERTPSNAMALQTEVARAIARAVEARLTPLEEERLQEGSPVAPLVQEAHFKGRYQLGQITAEGALKARDHFLEAVALDSTYAPAHAGLAETWYWLTQYHQVLPPREGMPLALAEAERALRLDDSLGEAHLFRGFVLFVFDWNFAEAEREFRRALELNPGSALCHWGLGAYLVVAGRPDEGLELFRQALTIDPFSLGARIGLGEMLFHARRFDQAIAENLKTLELDPEFSQAYVHLEKAYLAKEMYGEAIAARRQRAILENRGQEWVEGLAVAYAASGRSGYWLYRRDSAERNLTSGHRALMDLAEIHAALQDRDAAFAWLDSAVAARIGDLVLLRVDPQWDNLRDDPRFARLLRKIGLEP